MDFREDIHRLRGLAIAAIVGGHCISTTVWLQGTPAERLVSLLFNNWTVLFVFISGYLFAHLHARDRLPAGYGELMGRKLRYVGLPYLLVSIPLWGLMLLGYTDEPRWIYERWFDAPTTRYGVYLLTGAHARQFWFIPAILLIFSLAPLWRWALAGRNRVWWLCLLLVPLSMWVPRTGNRDLTLIPLRVVHFASCFAFGMAVAHSRDRFDAHKRKLAWAFAGVAIGGALWAWSADHRQAPHYSAGNYLFKMSLAPLLMWTLDRETRGAASRVLHRVLGELAVYSFGIYFVHVYVIDVLHHRLAPGFRIRYFKTGGWIAQSLVVLVATYLAVWMLRRIAGSRSRELIGVQPRRPNAE